MALNNRWMSAIFVALIGLTAVLGGLSYDVGTLTRMGPGFFPIAIGALLMLCAGLLCLGSDGQNAASEATFSLRPTFFILLAVATFGLVLQWFGLFLAVFAAIVVASLAVSANGWVPMLLLALGASTACSLLFGVVIGMPIDLFRLP